MLCVPIVCANTFATSCTGGNLSFLLITTFSAFFKQVQRNYKILKKVLHSNMKKDMKHHNKETIKGSFHVGKLPNLYLTIKVEDKQITIIITTFMCC